MDIIGAHKTDIDLKPGAELLDMENVILVDDNDIVQGTMEKMQAHLTGSLHRAISVFIFNSRGEFLLQQRALEKYHSAGKWSNTSCSHPRPGESNIDAAHRRLKEEMGLSCELKPWFNFTYHAEFENGLTEHEYDHVFIGTSNALPHPDPLEVASFKYIGKEELEADIHQNPEQYTVWFKLCLDHINKKNNGSSL